MIRLKLTVNGKFIGHVYRDGNKADYYLVKSGSIVASGRFPSIDAIMESLEHEYAK